jgi:hypothetical protein
VAAIGERDVVLEQAKLSFFWSKKWGNLGDLADIEKLAFSVCGGGGNFEICEFLRKNANFGTYPAGGLERRREKNEQANFEKMRQNGVIEPGHSCGQATGTKKDTKEAYGRVKEARERRVDAEAAVAGARAAMAAEGDGVHAEACRYTVATG